MIYLALLNGTSIGTFRASSDIAARRIARKFVFKPEQIGEQTLMAFEGFEKVGRPVDLWGDDEAEWNLLEAL